VKEKETLMSLVKVRIGDIVYYVKDIVRTEKFYRDVLGLNVENMGDDGYGGYWLRASTANGIDLLFFQNPELKAGASPAIVYRLEEGGIDTMVEGLAKKGATIVTPVSHAPGGFAGTLADPDGHAFGFYQTQDKPRRKK
jgi:glyoxylase I family protein